MNQSYPIFLQQIFFYSDAVEFRASDDNIARIENILETPNLPKEVKQQQLSILKKLKANRGSFVNPFGEAVIKNELDSIFIFPKHVAILTDTNNASSAEQFILSAIQSDKVITFGVGNTAGVLDYANLYVEFAPTMYHSIIFSKLSLSNVFGRAFSVPTSRSLRLNKDKFDDHGYAPDILIPHGSNNKIEYIKQYMINQ